MRLTSNLLVSCDIVLISIGVVSAIHFLHGSGVSTDKGVLVSERLQTNIPNIFAAGDVAQAGFCFFQN